MLRVGINGFGRIGRAIYRVNAEKCAFKVVAVNDINPDIGNIAYTVNYDSLYNRLRDPFTVDESRPQEIRNSQDEIRVFHEASIDAVPWEAKPASTS
jgi:glyceraldehyde 3-phosphate dehydrogenase